MPLYASRNWQSKPVLRVALGGLIKLCPDRVRLNLVGGLVDHYGDLSLFLWAKPSVSWPSCQVGSVIPGASGIIAGKVPAGPLPRAVTDSLRVGI